MYMSYYKREYFFYINFISSSKDENQPKIKMLIKKIGEQKGWTLKWSQKRRVAHKNISGVTLTQNSY